MHEEKILDGIVCDEEIQATVVIDVSGYDAQGFPGRLSNHCVVSDFGECTVAIVVKKIADRWMEGAGNTVVLLTSGVAAAGLPVFRQIPHEATDEKI